MAAYTPVPDLKNSEMACRTASTELRQTGHFHDQAQIAVVIAGWVILRHTARNL